MKNIPIDKALCEHLEQYHKGQENAASSKELEAAFHVKGTELRRAVCAASWTMESNFFAKVTPPFPDKI